MNFLGKGHQTKKKLLIFDIKPTSLGYKLYSILKDYWDITLISLSNNKKYDEKIYKDLGIKVTSFNLMGQRYLKDKKFFLGIKEGLRFFFKILKLKLQKYDFVLARGTDLGGKIAFKIFKRQKKIYFPYDIGFLVWGLKLGERTKKEIKDERYCFEHADFIIHKGPKDELNLIKKEEVKNIPGRPIQFLPYCFNKWAIPIKEKKDKLKGLHLVYVGIFFPQNCEMLKISHSDLFRCFANQEMNIHIYSDSIASKIKGKNIHCYNEISNLELNKKMSKYHYGILTNFHNLDIIDTRLLKTTIANKFISYLEAGIPMIINNETKYMAEIIKKYNCGVIISEKDLSNLKKILEKQNYPELLKGVKKARKYFSFENQKKNIVKGFGLQK